MIKKRDDSFNEQSTVLSEALNQTQVLDATTYRRLDASNETLVEGRTPLTYQSKDDLRRTSTETLEERAAEYASHLANEGLAYPESAKALEVSQVYNHAVSQLTHNQPKTLQNYREALQSTIESVELPSPSQYKPGSPEAIAAAREAITKVIGVLGSTREEPTDLQRLLITQGAKHFPLMDDVELWALREQGEGKEKKAYWEHAFTHSPEREEEVEKLGIEEQAIISKGKATRGYGRQVLHENQGSLFYSTSQKDLSSQDPQNSYFGSDEILIQGALYAMSVGDDELFEKHKEDIRKIVAEFRGKNDEEIRQRRKELREKHPTLADKLNQVDVPLWLDGDVVGYLKANYRLKNLAMGSVARDFERREETSGGLNTMVLDEDQRKSGSPEIDRWLVENYALGMKYPETVFLLEAEDEEGNKRFPIPTAEELEENPQAWNRLHALNSHQRYVHSQKLREWVIKGKRDEGLETLLGEEKRKEILRTIEQEHAKDPTNQHIPQHLEEVEGVRNAGLQTVYGRLLLPVMEEHFENELEGVQHLYGLQRKATPEDMQAVTKELEVTEPDPAAKVALLEAVNAVAPYLVEALGHTPQGTRIEPTEGKLEQEVQRMDLLGQTRANYEYGEVLGQGGMGIVLKARHTKLGRQVALKLLSGTSLVSREGEEYKRRFDKEILVGGRLNHPNIVGVQDAGEEGHLHYMALEYIDGGDVKEKIIREQGKMNWKEVHQMLTEMGRALTHTEEQGIIHRDIKPENIMIDTTKGEETYKLADFGIALEKNDEAEGMIVGTPNFMAPEQLKGQPNNQSDLYSLGATAYNALTGRTPYMVRNIEELIPELMTPERKPIPLTTYNEEVPTELVHIIEKLMEKDTEQRYQNAQELLEDLEGMGGPASTTPRLHPKEGKKKRKGAA